MRLFRLIFANALPGEGFESPVFNEDENDDHWNEDQNGTKSVAAHDFLIEFVAPS